MSTNNALLYKLEGVQKRGIRFVRNDCLSHLLIHNSTIYLTGIKIAAIWKMAADIHKCSDNINPAYVIMILQHY